MNEERHRLPKKKEKPVCPHCGKVIPKKIAMEHYRLIAKETGSAGGKETAKKGSEYFKEIANKRWGAEKKKKAN